MWKKLLLGLFLVFLLSSSAVYADVVLTDEQAQELDQTLDELEIVLKEQQTTISDLEKQNELLKNDSMNKQKSLDEQKNKINDLETSLEEQKKSSLMHGILTVVISFLIGAVIGLMF